MAYRAYPKSLNLPLGRRTSGPFTKVVGLKTITWTETQEIYWPVIVNSRAEQKEIRALARRAVKMGLFIEIQWEADDLRKRVYGCAKGGEAADSLSYPLSFDKQCVEALRKLEVSW